MIFEESVDTKPADFETAIKATGFGKFNILLVLTILPCVFSQVFETAALSYVFPVAQCDLGLTLEDKGILNAITFAGMTASAFLWGYLSDTIGRRRVIVFGYFLTGFFSIITSCSQNVTMLIAAKFFGGFMVTGPFATITSYLSEFHASQYRARIQLVRGIAITVGVVLLPLLAWGVLPRSLNFTLFGYFDFHSWNVFLFMCGLAPVTAGLVYIFMPESPKFLMSVGRNEEALKVFQTIYGINSGKSVEFYSVKFLLDENLQKQASPQDAEIKRTTKEAIKIGLLQIKPLFMAPNIYKLIHVCSNACLLLMSFNTLQLWLPQLFQSVNDYQLTHNASNPNICEMLQQLTTINSSTETSCVVNLDNSSVYINSTIVGTAQVLAFIVAGFFVNLLGKKKLSIIMAFVSGCCAICIYFVQSSEALLIFSAIFLSFAGVCANILVTTTLELFPTTLRGMALSMHMLGVRTGTITGNILFPILLYGGCAPPFIYSGCLAFGCALLCLLYQNTDNKALK